MKYEAVIFDMDGTLLDTIDDIADSANQILKDEGYPEHPVSSYCQFVGNGARKLMERALPHEHSSNGRLIDRLLEKFRDVYKARQFNKTDLYDGIANMLEELKGRGIPMAILSNKPHSFVVEIAKHYFDESLFVSIAGQKENMEAKPAPEGAVLAARALNVPESGCLFVGDSSVDMQTAVNAGMTAVGVSWGFRSVEELKAHGADHIIDSPGQLLSLVK